MLSVLYSSVNHYMSIHSQHYRFQQAFVEWPIFPGSNKLYYLHAIAVTKAEHYKARNGRYFYYSTLSSFITSFSCNISAQILDLFWCLYYNHFSLPPLWVLCNNPTCQYWLFCRRCESVHQYIFIFSSALVILDYAFVAFLIEAYYLMSFA